MTTAETARALALTLLTAAAGAALFWAIGFPAAPLTGSAAAVTAASLLGIRTHIPVTLRNLCFLALGMNIGSGVTPEVIDAAATWPASFAVLAVTLVLSMLSTRWMLERYFGFDRRTASLAAAPGHLSYVLGYATGTNANVAAIGIAQTTRVLFLTLCVPPLIAVLFGDTGISVLPAEVIRLDLGLVLLGLSAAVGFAFTWARLPAAFLLAGMFVSAIGHLTELAPGRLSVWAALAAFLVMGSLIGTRFEGVSPAALRRYMLAGLAITAVVLCSAMIGVMITMAMLGLPPSLLIVAFAPGGVEAMAAIAVQAGLDPAFVAAHHVVRLFLLTFLIPLFARGGSDPSKARAKE